MFFTETLIEAAEKCFTRGMPFAIVFHPDEIDAEFYASSGTIVLDRGLPENWKGFVVSSFGLGSNQAPMGIAADFTPDSICNMDDSVVFQPKPYYRPTPTESSTSFSDYEKSVKCITESLAGKTGKVVISRIAVEASDINPFTVAEKYFNVFPKCFKTVYFTPKTGLWIVATPELLLNYDYTDETLRTMSLAGTRERLSGDWDEKNIREHELVTEYIKYILEEAGMEVNIGESENLPFGNIEHLCNRVEAVGPANPISLAIKLSPTPAVCGWPVEKAYRTIMENEDHERGCYGGFIGTACPKNIKLYVNLRCCRIQKISDNKFDYMLYAGGGINNMSDPLSEWEEASGKMAILRKIIKGTDA